MLKEDRRFSISCERGHRRRFDATALECFINTGEFECKQCKEVYSLDEPLEMVCHICSDSWEVADLEEAQEAMNSTCRHCEDSGGWEELSYHIPGSWGMLRAQFGWVQRDRGTKSLKRDGRDDYWEGLIHFCTAEQFGAIYKSGRIRASRTGYYKRPAVCLTEATAGGWDELRSLHGQFGFVFKKRDILKAGGGPALYLPQHLIRAQEAQGGFDDKLKPFVNTVRTKHTDPKKKQYYYLHEREWRSPHDVVLNEIALYGVITGHFDVKTKGWQDIFHAKINYPEIVLEGGDDNDDELDDVPVSENTEF